MRKIVTVLGARPQFIKASVVSHVMRQSDALVEVLVHTGQHFDDNMSEVFFTELELAAPAYNLGVNGGTHGAMTGRMLIEIERVLLTERPDLVLVYGDTNSTLAGALAAAKLCIPVAHVEAGLRSFNSSMPEEINRILTDRIARWLFTPTEIAVSHLIGEGVPSEQIVPVGDVMYDVARHHGARVSADERLVQRLNLRAREYLLVTIHRAENTDDESRLIAIIDALQRIADETRIVWPLHPRTRAALEASGRLDSLARHVSLIDPVGYLDMVQLEKYASVIATDSGGVQKEAFFHKVPCVTLRGETEWVELLDSGWNRLAPPTDSERIVTAIRAARGTTGRPVSPYGNGDAAERIVSHLVKHLT